MFFSSACLEMYFRITVCVIQKLIMCWFHYLTFAWSMIFFLHFSYSKVTETHTKDRKTTKSTNTGMCLIFILVDMLDESLPCIMIKTFLIFFFFFTEEDNCFLFVHVVYI